MFWDAVRALARLLGQLILAVVRPIWIMVRTVFQIREGEIMRPILLFTAVAICGWVLTVVVHNIQWRSAPASAGQVTGLGAVAAEETVRLVGSTAKILILKLDSQSSDSSYALTVASFKPALTKLAGGVMVQATEKVKPEPQSRGENISGHEFVELVNQYRFVDAIVSFAVVPKLTKDDYNRLPPVRPKIIIVSMPLSDDTKELLSRNVVQLAIVARPAPAAPPPLTATPREWFDSYFRLVDKSTINQSP